MIGRGALPLSVALAGALALSQVQAAQCQGPDGAWYDYTSPMCQSTPSRPDWLEPGAHLDDPDLIKVLTTRGVVIEKGFRCATVSAYRICLSGCNWLLECDGGSAVYELIWQGTHIYVGIRK